MKRLQIYIEQDSDEALAQEAAASGQSKAEIIRRLVRQHIATSVDHDPIDDLVGFLDIPAADVDDVVYGR